jgi:hypothetical protein
VSAENKTSLAPSTLHHHTITHKEAIMECFSIDTYSYDICSPRYDSVDPAAVITLRNGTNGKIATLNFHYVTSWANRNPVLAGQRVSVSYHISMLDAIIDMLRNEDSVVLYYDIGNKLAYLKTGGEEVGEEET